MDIIKFDNIKLNLDETYQTSINTHFDYKYFVLNHFPLNSHSKSTMDPCKKIPGLPHEANFLFLFNKTFNRKKDCVDPQDPLHWLTALSCNQHQSHCINQFNWHHFQ